MNFAIIAAGEGQRLKEEGLACPKPLVKINGVTLIDRLLGLCIANGATSISCIVNQDSADLIQHMENLELPVRLNLYIKSTPSSLHSLYELRTYLWGVPFVLMTTDTIFNPLEFQEFLSLCRTQTQKSVIAVTDFVDDEKPLYAQFNNNGTITKFSDTPVSSNYVTGGIYFFHNDIFESAARILTSGQQRLRNLLKYLVENGYQMKAYKFSKMIDVDHVSDIPKAEAFLNGESE